MVKLAWFYIKVFVKTPLFFISLLFSIFIFIVQLGALKHSSIVEYTNVICFAMISLNLYFLISTSSALAKRYEIMEFLEVDSFKKYLSIIFAGVIISLIVSLIPIAFIIVFRNSNISNYFLLKGIVNLFIILNISNLISIVIGASIGILFRKWISIVVSLLIYSFFPLNLFNPVAQSNVINKFLNIYGDSTVITTNILCDEIFNILYLCDKLIILLAIGLIILVIKILIDKKKKLLAIISSFVILVFMGLTISVGMNSVSFIHEYDISKMDNLNYHISTYKMNLNIGNSFRNNVSFQLDIDKPNDSIVLLLDDLFKINEVKINDSPTQFTHKNNEIILNYKSNDKEKIDISISYEGYIHVQDSLGVDTFYCNNHEINLTDSFLWYPYINNKDFPINYTIKTNSLSTIYSNLDTKVEGNEYLLEGIAQTVSLFSGQYRDVFDEGIEYIIPSSYNLDNLKMDVDEFITDCINNSENDTSKLNEKKYKKVIVGMKVDNYSGIKLSGDVLLLDL